MRDSREDPESLEREQLDLRKRLLTPEERDTIINTSRLELISDAERKRIVLASMPDFEREEITPESEIREVKPIRPKIIDSKSKLDCVILHNSELKLRKGYDSQYERAVEYFDRGMNGYPPILVRETEDTLIRFVYEEVHGGPPKVVIESMDDVDNLLEKKPEEKDNAEFQERYRKTMIFFDVRYNDSKTQVELASENDIQQARISEFQRGVEPALISRLRRFEEKRLITEWKENRSNDYHQDQGPDILERYLKSRHSETVELVTSSMHNISVGGSSKLNGVLRELDMESFGEKDIVSIANEISRELAEKESKVTYWILDDSILEEHLQILSMLKENSVGLEREVRKQSSDQSIHLGIVDDRLYLWNPDRTPDDMMNVWGKKYFYFNPNIFGLK